MMDSISRRQNLLLNAQMEAQAAREININIDEVAKLKLLRQREKKVTIEKDAKTTKFII